MKQIKIPCLDYELAADWYEGTNDKVLLVLPGWSSNKKNYTDSVSDVVARTGTSALVLDYGGHGESPFELRNVSPAQNLLETITAFDWLGREYPDKKINVMGNSYGGFFGVHLTNYRVFDKLVLTAPAIYWPNEFYNRWSIRLDDVDGYTKREAELRGNSEELARQPLVIQASSFQGRTFIVVHENDELVLRPTTDAYIKALNARSYIAKNFPHNFPKDTPEAVVTEYRQAIADFLQGN